MKIVNFPPQRNQVGASGTCPHCSVESYFRPVATYQDRNEDGRGRIASTAECEACKGFVIVVGVKTITQSDFALSAVYPYGKPKDSVSPEIPPNIAGDFREALRCQWIMAFRATVVMCARAIQGSALQLGAKKKKLTDQIDELFAKGKITESLKDFAHEIRVTRNLGAHPDKDGLEEVDAHDAAAIVEFTHEYLHHVYVMPARLKARRDAAETQARDAGKSRTQP